MANRRKSDLIELLYTIGTSEKATAKERLAAAERIIELMRYNERKAAKKKDQNASRLLGAKS